MRKGSTLLSAAEKWKKKWRWNMPGGVRDMINSGVMGAENRLGWAERWVGVQEKNIAITCLEESIQSGKVKNGW